MRSVNKKVLYLKSQTVSSSYLDAAKNNCPYIRENALEVLESKLNYKINLEKENVSLLRGIPHIFNNPRKRSCLT